MSTQNTFACTTCATTYQEITDAIACHPPEQSNHYQSTTNTPVYTTYHHALFARTHNQRDDSLKRHLQYCLENPATRTTHDSDSILTRIKDGLSQRLNNTDTHNDLTLAELTFLQAIEAMRVGAYPDAFTTSMIRLRDDCLHQTTTTEDDLTQYITTNTTPTNTKYYHLTQFARNTLPITTFHTTGTSHTPGLDDPYPVNHARHTLTQTIADNCHHIDTIHHPHPTSLADTFPLPAIDIAGFTNNHLTHAALFITNPDTQPLIDLVNWATTIPASIQLITTTHADTRTLVSELATTPHLTLNRDTTHKPLTDTTYRTSTITEFITWPNSTNITLRALPSLY